MTGLSSNGEATVLTALLAARFVSLHTADPGNTGASELATGAYARQAATFTQSGNNPTIAANSGIIQYPVATASWGTITHFGIWSAVTGGQFLGGWVVEVPKAVGIDDSVRWNVGALKIGTDEIIP